MVLRLFFILCSIISVQAAEHSDIIQHIKTSTEFKVVQTKTPPHALNEDSPIEIESWIIGLSLQDFVDAQDFNVYLWTLDRMGQYHERLYIQVKALGTPLMGSLVEYLYDMYITANNIKQSSLQCLFKGYYDKIKQSIDESHR